MPTKTYEVLVEVIVTPSRWPKILAGLVAIFVVGCILVSGIGYIFDQNQQQSQKATAVSNANAAATANSMLAATVKAGNELQAEISMVNNNPSKAVIVQRLKMGTFQLKNNLKYITINVHPQYQIRCTTDKGDDWYRDWVALVPGQSINVYCQEGNPAIDIPTCLMLDYIDPVDGYEYGTNRCLDIPVSK